jgi:hypothetical protein
MKIKPELIHPGKEVMSYSMKELIFEVTQEADGGYVAECLTEPIVTQGDDWVSMRSAVDEAVRGYFFDAPAAAPSRIRLHLVRDESFAFA